MDPFWNSRTLAPPTICNIPYTAAEQREGEIIRSLQTVVEVLDSFQYLSDAQKSLDAERFIMARTIFSTKNQFRSDKRQQIMKKIDQCLKRNAALKINDVVLELQGQFPGQGVCDFHPHFSNAVYIPSRQMYEHLLAKCIGSAALLQRCASLCLDAFLNVRQTLAHGYYFQQMPVVGANLSRIWILCRHLIMETDSLYKKLRGVLSNLRPVVKPWVPEGEQLPEDLSQYLVLRADAEVAQNLMTELQLDDLWDASQRADKPEAENEEKSVESQNSSPSQVQSSSLPACEEDIGVSMRRPGDCDEDIGVVVKRATEELQEDSSDADKTDANKKRKATGDSHMNKKQKTDKHVLKRKPEEEFEELDLPKKPRIDLNFVHVIPETSMKKKKKKKKQKIRQTKQAEEVLDENSLLGSDAVECNVQQVSVPSIVENKVQGSETKKKKKFNIELQPDRENGYKSGEGIKKKKKKKAKSIKTPVAHQSVELKGQVSEDTKDRLTHVKLKKKNVNSSINLTESVDDIGKENGLQDSKIKIAKLNGNSRKKQKPHRKR